MMFGALAGRGCKTGQGGGDRWLRRPTGSPGELVKDSGKRGMSHLTWHGCSIPARFHGVEFGGDVFGQEPTQQGLNFMPVTELLEWVSGNINVFCEALKTPFCANKQPSRVYDSAFDQKQFCLWF